MERVNFIAGRIRDYTCKPGVSQSFLWDTGAPGLAVRATDAGSKAFIFQGKLSGQSIRITIGDVRTWGIDAARTEARRLQTLIDQGIDPRHDKAERIAVTVEKQEAARRQGVTVGAAWDAYLKARKPKWGDRHYLNHVALAKAGGEPRGRGRRKGEPATTRPGPLHPLLALRLADLDAEAVKSWLEPEAERAPTQAAQAWRALRAFVAWCADHAEFRDETHRDACSRRIARDTLPKPKAKDDCLQREQLALWFGHVRKLSNPVQAAYLQTLLLIGSRRGELSSLKWKDVDFRWKSIVIHDKMEGLRTIPLTPYVSSLLAALPRRNEWVFSSLAAASGRLQEPRIAHVRALTAAGLPALSLHGLRRSFGTLSEWVECPVGVVAQIQGHKPSALAEKHYRRRPLDLLRLWHTKIEGWILNEAGIEQQPAEGETGLRVVA